MDMSSEELFNLQILAERAVKEKIEKMKGMIVTIHFILCAKRSSERSAFLIH